MITSQLSTNSCYQWLIVSLTEAAMPWISAYIFAKGARFSDHNTEILGAQTWPVSEGLLHNHQGHLWSFVAEEFGDRLLQQPWESSDVQWLCVCIYIYISLYIHRYPVVYTNVAWKIPHRWLSQRTKPPLVRGFSIATLDYVRRRREIWKSTICRSCPRETNGYPKLC